MMLHRLRQFIPRGAIESLAGALMANPPNAPLFAMIHQIVEGVNRPIGTDKGRGGCLSAVGYPTTSFGSSGHESAVDQSAVIAKKLLGEGLLAALMVFESA